MQWAYWIRQRTHCVTQTPINLLSVRDRLHLEWEERLLLDCSISTKRQEGRRSEWTEIRQARLDRQCIHSVESVAFSRSISVELDGEGSTCTENLKFEFWRYYITHPLISSKYYCISLLRLAPTVFYIFTYECHTDTFQGVTVFPDVTYSAIVMIITSLPYL